MKKFLFFSVVFFLFSFRHPFYLSVTDLKYNPREKALQGSVKLFINDLEGALKKIHGRTIDLVNPKDTLVTKKLLRDYLTGHLSFQVNGASLTYEMIGFEREQEALWLYIELKHCAPPKHIKVTNRLLYDAIKEQMNIVRLEVGAKEKSLKVTYPEKLMEFDFTQ
jgi:hypothetical protein